MLDEIPTRQAGIQPGAGPIDVAISLCAHRKFSLRYSRHSQATTWLSLSLFGQLAACSRQLATCIVYGLPHERRVNSPSFLMPNLFAMQTYLCTPYSSLGFNFAAGEKLILLLALFCFCVGTLQFHLANNAMFYKAYT